MKQISTLGVLLAATLMLGCHSQQKNANDDFFTPSTDKVELEAFYEREAAAQTYADPTLYAFHFTGANLNSLGKAKLDALLASCERPALVEIYLTGSLDTSEHRQAISTYLTSHGCKANQFVLVDGPDPNSYTLARRSIVAEEKVNETSSLGDNSGVSGGSSGSTGTGVAGR